jgi:hypothetical protein
MAKQMEISNTKLSRIKNYILPLPINTFTRKEEVAINSLRINHTRLTHILLMMKKDLPTRLTCNYHLMVNQKQEV